MEKIKWYRLTIWLLAVFCTSAAFAQADTTKKETRTDSIKMDFVAKMQAFAKKSALSSAADFDADKAAIAQTRIFGEIKATMQKAKAYIKNGLDTVGAKAQLTKIDKIYTVAGDGVFTDKGTAQTFRNLTATSKILLELLSQANGRKTHLEVYRHDLTTFRYELDSLLSLPPLFKFPKDSAVLASYIQQIIVVDKEISPVDSALKVANKNVQLLLNRYSLQAIKLQTGIEEIEIYQRGMANNTFKREFGNIWQQEKGYSRPFIDILRQSQAKGLLTLVYYLQNNLGKLFILVLLIITCFIYVRSLKSIYIEKKLLEDNSDGQLILKRPVLSAFIIVINIFQFFFISPPFALNVIFWGVVSVSLAFLFRGFIARYWMNVWLIMLALFLIAAGDNLILQATRTERWIMLVIALLGTLTGAIAILKGPKAELREKWILTSIGLMALLELASAVANVWGRYNLSKTLLISGYLNVIVAILFLWTVRLINEGLYLAFNVYTRQDKKLFYLNFDKVGKKAPVLFYIFLVFGWAVLFGRNFAGFQYIAKPMQEFFDHERSLGDYTFSINKLLLFVVIVGISVITSKIVSYFASDNHLHINGNKTPGIGSWLLLIRIAILSIGLFLGIAAAGIPVDRITIVIGALGVGIGFGLQTLVNNLVSGLIIAFEKPVNVGDIVDIEGHGGTIKSIGFRSSVISTWDGADMVMPNGDLLNSHLTNWSLGGNRKRISILIGIAYDADLQKVKQILSDVLQSDDRIALIPSPVVQYEQFSDSSIDVKVYFWAKHMSEAFATRSDLIINITQAFRLNAIEIPYPQQDVHLRNAATRGNNDI